MSGLLNRSVPVTHRFAAAAVVVASYCDVAPLGERETSPGALLPGAVALVELARVNNPAAGPDLAHTLLAVPVGTLAGPAAHTPAAAAAVASAVHAASAVSEPADLSSTAHGRWAAVCYVFPCRVLHVLHPALAASACAAAGASLQGWRMGSTCSVA